ncbi:hypothetical protein B0H34DRAFT_737037 [Crassisporium funariophilum]|nr:hypothetical protein B0H34DRAFT_737037 [Crassisporium funariophilum]
MKHLIVSLTVKSRWCFQIFTSVTGIAFWTTATGMALMDILSAIPQVINDSIINIVCLIVFDLGGRLSLAKERVWESPRGKVHITTSRTIRCSDSRIEVPCKTTMLVACSNGLTAANSSIRWRSYQGMDVSNDWVRPDPNRDAEIG